MSKVAIQGNASGTGTFTIAAPNSNTDRTLTLPDEAGTVLTSASSINGANAGPMFRAALAGANQTVSHNTTALVQFETEVFDTDNCFDNSSTYRFTPTVAGYYNLTTHIVFDPPGGSNFYASIRISKNGVRSVSTEIALTTGSGQTNTGNANTVVYANGSTDYFEVYFFGYDYSTSSNFTLLSAGDYRYSAFQGILVRAD